MAVLHIYEILAKPQNDVVTIQTQDYGEANIYNGTGTDEIIKKILMPISRCGRWAFFLLYFNGLVIQL